MLDGSLQQALMMNSPAIDKLQITDYHHEVMFPKHITLTQ